MTRGRFDDIDGYRDLLVASKARTGPKHVTWFGVECRLLQSLLRLCCQKSDEGVDRQTEFLPLFQSFLCAIRIRFNNAAATILQKALANKSVQK